jgi:hypothetical protein
MSASIPDIPERIKGHMGITQMAIEKISTPLKSASVLALNTLVGRDDFISS